MASKIDCKQIGNPFENRLQADWQSLRKSLASRLEIASEIAYKDIGDRSAHRLQPD
jgi:hypothetical protein